MKAQAEASQGYNIQLALLHYPVHQLLGKLKQAKAMTIQLGSSAS
jgi:hypothetical protein